PGAAVVLRRRLPVQLRWAGRQSQRQVLGAETAVSAVLLLAVLQRQLRLRLRPATIRQLQRPILPGETVVTIPLVMVSQAGLRRNILWVLKEAAQRPRH